MLSGVLNSEQAIEVNIAIMRAFVRLRQMLKTNEELNRKFAAVSENSLRTTNIFELCSMNSRSSRRTQFRLAGRSDFKGHS